MNINVKIEAKSKLNRKYIGEVGVNDNLIISLERISLFTITITCVHSSLEQ